LVTGASSGLGRAFACALTAAGVEVIGVSRDPATAVHEGCARWVAADLAFPGAAERLLNEHPQLLDCDLLVNNAGAGYFARLDQADPWALREQCELLLLQPIELTRRFYAAMRARRAGTIVNVSSLAAHLPIPLMPAYDAAKAGLSQFTRALMLEAANSGVQVVDFQPGDYRTGFNRALRRDAPDPQARAQYAESDAAGDAVWRSLEAHMAASPDAAHAARCLMRVLARGRGGSFSCGGFFQARIALLGYRVLPWRVMAHLIRRYYGLS